MHGCLVPTNPIIAIAETSRVLLSATPTQEVADSILEWVSLLHVRTPVCNVMLIASHFDMLRGATQQENEQLLATVEERCVTPKPPHAGSVERQFRLSRSLLCFSVRAGMFYRPWRPRSWRCPN